MKFTSAPLRIKLVAALILPVIVVAGYLALRVDGAFDAQQVASRQEDEVARFSTVSELSQAIGAEQTVLVNTTAGNEELANARVATDAAVAAVQDAGLSSDQLAEVDALVEEVAAIRERLGDDVNQFRILAAGEVATGATEGETRVAGVLRLAEIAKQIVDQYDFDATAVADVDTARGLNDIALVQNVRRNFAAEINVALGLSTIGAESRTADAIEFFSEAQAATTAALANLGSQTTPDVQVAVAGFLASPEYAQIDALRTTLDAAEPFGEMPVGSLDIIAAGTAADTALGSVEASLAEQLLTNASELSANAQWDLVRSAGVGAGLFLLVVLILIALYRSIRNPLGRLTERSQQIAKVELPAVVAQMRRGDTDERPDIEPLVAESNDEIGELVHAFNGMHRTAIELASEQAASRRVVADMFVNLGRRNQRLLNRMLKGLTKLERNEPDPDTLAALYEIDHLATRMRRNAESLLILAGASQARRWKNPVAAYDVLHASLAEVEGYDRVRIDAPHEATIHGDYVADLTHLLAELVENALSFSPVTSPVQVLTRSTSRGFMIVVVDEGLGMTAELLDAANARISAAAEQEESPSEFLGHYVVGRLAARHGIEVELLEGVTGGLTARVILPQQAIAQSESTDEQNPTRTEAPSTDTSTPIRSSMDWNSFEHVSQVAERPLAAPTPHLSLSSTLVVPPSPAALDTVDAATYIETDVDGATSPSVDTTVDVEPPAAADAAPELDAQNDLDMKLEAVGIDMSATNLRDTSAASAAEIEPSPADLAPVTAQPAPVARPSTTDAEPSLDEADAHCATTDELVGDLVDATESAVSNLTVFGSTRRTPVTTRGAETPAITPSTTDAVTTDAANDDPDAVRSSLSSFQTATVRADREA